jgi:3-deoxy-D-manno-octulosonic-acid transferase
MPFVFLKLLWRGYKAPEYRARKLERFGVFKAPTLHRSIWVHAVSVGEVLAAEPIIKEIQHRFPGRDIVITSMTPTSSEQIIKRFGSRVFHVYAPYDLPFMVNAFLNRVKPECLIIMETELWPNMIHQVMARKCPVVIANARLSERSAKGYRRLKPAIGWMLNELSLVLCQYQNDADRFESLKIAREKIFVTGSVKFDLDVDSSHAEKCQNIRVNLPVKKPIWIAASTHEGEDEKLLQVHKELRVYLPDALLILVPRHPERFESAEQHAVKYGFETSKRTSEAAIPSDAEVYVVDTMGELMDFYAMSDIAFIGGSLVEVGGHNPIEPGALGLPIVIGPHHFNFEAICHQLVTANAMEIVQDESELLKHLVYLFTHPDEVRRRGKEALAVVASSKGAVNRVVDHLAPLLEK